MKTLVFPLKDFSTRNNFRNAMSDSSPDDAVITGKFLQCVTKNVSNFCTALHLSVEIYFINKIE